MPYVDRDENGDVVAFYQQQQRDGQEHLAEDDAAIQDFMQRQTEAMQVSKPAAP